MTPTEYLAKWRDAAESIRKGATPAEVLRLHGISVATVHKLVRLIRAGVKVQKNPRERSGPGQGRKPIPAAEYLARWSPVVDALKAGLTNRAIKETTGACGPTVRHVMQFMRDEGWAKPVTIKKERPKKERPPRIPKPPKLPMTRDERLAKYPDIVRLLRAGKTRRQIAKLTGVGPKILALAKEASKTGEPIVKPMAMAFPDGGYETIKDQFVLGNDIIVAPVVVKGARSRSVVLPKGEWKSEDGTIHTGGATLKIEVPLQRLPYFVKM